MTRLFPAALLATGLLAFGFSPPAPAQAKQDFTLVNSTGYAFSEIYISPSKQNRWGEDMLASDDESMENGESRNIHFTGFNGVCRFDLKVVYEEDDSDAIWNDIDLCKVSKITLFWNSKSNVTTAVFD